MSYSYLKVLDLDTNTTMYKSIRVIDSYTSQSYGYLLNLVYSSFAKYTTL